MDPDELLKSGLELIRSKLPHRPPTLAYQWAYDFVLQHGKFYPPCSIPSGLRQGAQKQCFGNALIMAAVGGYRYVEGYVLSPCSSMPILHGWNADDSGALIDITWLNTGLSYLGVEFSVERADDAIWDGDSCVLDDFMRDWPIFREQWHGEDPNRAWPSSERLRLLRAGKVAEALELMSAEIVKEQTCQTQTSATSGKSAPESGASKPTSIPHLSTT